VVEVHELEWHRRPPGDRAWRRQQIEHLLR
jgi:hypothetical protein